MILLNQKTICFWGSSESRARPCIIHAACALGRGPLRPVLQRYGSRRAEAFCANLLRSVRSYSVGMVLSLATAGPLLADCRGSDLFEQLAAIDAQRLHGTYHTIMLDSHHTPGQLRACRLVLQGMKD